LKTPQESIKASQQWFMACGPQHAGGMALAMARRAAGLQDYARQLHVVYLANDILFKRCGGQGPWFWLCRPV
jgi:hypothetical protein